MKVGVFLLLLLSIGSSLRAPTVSWRCRRSRWCASTAGGEDPTPPTDGRVTRAPIYALQRSLVSPEATLKYLQSWATEAVTGTGTAIKLQSKFNGVRFLFAPAPAAYLDFDVVTGMSDGSAAPATDGDEVVIQMAFASADGDASQVRRLPCPLRPPPVPLLTFLVHFHASRCVRWSTRPRRASTAAF